MIDTDINIPGEIDGFLSGCPFCTSNRLGIPQVGTRFRIISGLNIGEKGTVIEWPKEMPSIRNEFMAQLDNQPDWITRISIQREKIQALPAPSIPKWAPPLCLEDASKLDSSVVKFCAKSLLYRKWAINWTAFNEIIKTVWYHRLPVEPNDLWAVLQAHGAPKRSKRSLVEFYNKGRKLLIYAAGRKPIKKKRVKPFSL